MSESEFRRLVADLDRDATMAQAAESERERGGDLVAFARVRGYEVTEDDLAAAGGEGELSDAELDGVAGGWSAITGSEAWLKQEAHRMKKARAM